MEWLIAHMWAGLGISVLAGLVIGWATRGLGSKPKSFYTAPFESEVEALQQKNTELEHQLIQMNREQTAVIAPDTQDTLNALHARLEDAQTQIASLSTELEARSTELEATRAGEPETANPVPDVSLADVSAHTEMTAEAEALQWRSQYLEARVRYLESRLSAAPQTMGEAVETVAAAPTLEPVVEGAQTFTAGTVDPEAAKMKWQNRYLRSRLRYFEEHLADTSLSSGEAETETVEPIVETPQVDPLVTELASYGTAHDIVTKLKSFEANLAELNQLRGQVSEEVSASSQAEQELARLRWRNRYLEGRLNYLENDPSLLKSVQSEIATPPVQPVQTTSTSPASSTSQAVTAFQSVSEGSEKRPESLEAARNGTADDLTRIDGIGQEIERVLNELGIFHYDQIAQWTPEEVAWVDGYLRFGGRIARDDWMTTAQSFIEETTSA